MNQPCPFQKDICEKELCLMDQAISVIGGKWTLLILCQLYHGTKRFGELQRRLNGISPKTLSLRLQELEKNGIILKKSYLEIPPRVEYSLTPKGADLKKVIAALVEWQQRNND